MAAAQNLIGQVGMYFTKSQVLFHGLYLKPNTTFSRPNSVPRSVSEFLKPAPCTCIRACFRSLRRNSPSSTQTQPCMEAKWPPIAVVAQPGPTRSVVVQMGSQARPGLDYGYESVFGIVALSFVFDNYCPIMA